MQTLGNVVVAVVSGFIFWMPQLSQSASGDHVTHWNTEWGPQPENVTDFTTFLWYGYSANKINFTKEDFRLFVECTTGKRRCPPLGREPPLSVLTDCDVNRDLSPAQCSILETCTDTDLMRAYGIEGDNLDVEDLQTLLPVVLYQSQRSSSCSQENSSKASKKPRSAEVWGYGLLFVTLISGCSLAGVSVLPLMAHKFYQQLLTLLVGLAVGSLAASSLFHLIPQAFSLRKNEVCQKEILKFLSTSFVAFFAAAHGFGLVVSDKFLVIMSFDLQASESGHHDYLFISLYVLLGIWCFFMIERLIKIIIAHQDLKEEKKKFPVSQSDQVILYENGCELQSPNKTDLPDEMNNYKQAVPGKTETESFEECEPASSTNTCGLKDVELIYASQEQAIKASFGHSERPQNPNSHSHTIEFRQGEDSVIRTVAWMIIFGDGFHNFIDGVSIGAAFSESILTGISISLAVMCEELPHELGDFAVLLNAGMTMKQAVAYNFLSATTCYLGLILGILLGEFTQNTTAIFALAAGMFLYIALVDMVPEMNEVASKAAEGGWRSAVCILILQNIGIFIGIALLFLLAYFQEDMVLV